MDISLERKLNKYEDIRSEITDKAYKQFKKLLIIGIILTPLFGIGLIIIILAFVGRDHEISSLSTKFKEELLNEIVSDTLDDARYLGSLGIDKSTVFSTGIFHNISRFYSEDLLIGKYKGMEYKTSDLVMSSRQNGNTGGVYMNTGPQPEIPVYKGKFISINLISNKDLIVVVTEKKKKYEENVERGLGKVLVESIDFNNKFNIYATSEQDAFYVLTPVLIEKMLELESHFRGSMGFVFRNGFLYVLINDGRDSLEIYPKNKVDEVFYRNIVSDITVACAIIDEFNLDSIKWGSLE